MGKFVLKCPHCNTVNNASTGLFAKKVIECGGCGRDININEAKLSAKICSNPSCGATFVYDQSKGKPGKDVKCPVCGKLVDAFHAKRRIAVNCPQCACAIDVSEDEATRTCPICDLTFNVEKERRKQDLVTSGAISVIQYEGDNSVFVWKHPVEDFNMGSQLIVHESQEAIFFMNGQALDLFGPGKYTLETESLPILKNIYKMPTGAQTPFHAEVYFINKTVHMGMKWGTDSRVRFVDPVTGIPLDIGASGEMNMQVVDSRKLLVKLVGTTGGLTNKAILSSQSDPNNTVHRTLQSYFRAPLMTEIKSYLASTIKAQKLDIMEIDEQMGILSEALKERIAPKFEEFGLTIPQFYITYIALPEDDPNFKKLRDMRAASFIGVRDEEVKAQIAEAAQRRRILEAQTEAQLAAIHAQGLAEVTRAKGLAEAEVMHAKGYSQKDVLEADVQKAYAEGFGQMGANAGNGGGGGGGGNMATDFMTMAASMKMAETMFEKMDFSMGQKKAEPQVAPAVAPVAPVAPAGWTCDCGHEGNMGKFCEECGKPKAETWDCACGHKGNRGKFCEECGAPKATTWDCACGQTGNTGKCCPECGAKRP